MTTTLVKQPAFIAAPSNDAGDFESGMQPSTSGSALGEDEAVDATLVDRADLGGDVTAGYFEVTVTLFSHCGIAYGPISWSRRPFPV